MLDLNEVQCLRNRGAEIDEMKQNPAPGLQIFHCYLSFQTGARRSANAFRPS